MKYLAPFLFGLIVGCAGAPVREAVQPSAKVASATDLAAKSVALVQRDLGGKVRSYCTGVWVSETSILTAYHCVDDAELGDGLEYAVREDIYAPGELHERPGAFTRLARVYALDEGHDLALLRALYAPSHGVAVVSMEPVRPGSLVQTMGHPRGLWWSYSSGDVAAVRQEEINGMDILWVQATPPISAGSSGGGLFDECGLLVGVAHATNPKGQSLNMFVHGQYVDAFLRKQTWL